MTAKDRYPAFEGLQEARWNAVMDELEAHWLTRIADTQAEYQEERTRLYGEKTGSSDGETLQLINNLTER